jgi:hypothetical protein
MLLWLCGRGVFVLESDNYFGLLRIYGVAGCGLRVASGVSGNIPAIRRLQPATRPNATKAQKILFFIRRQREQGTPANE